MALSFVELELCSCTDKRVTGGQSCSNTPEATLCLATELPDRERVRQIEKKGRLKKKATGQTNGGKNMAEIEKKERLDSHQVS